MKASKIIFVSLFVITGLLLIAGLFFKKGEYNVDFEITVNKPFRQVFDSIKCFKNLNTFSDWVNIDAGMKSRMVGRWYCWVCICVGQKNKDAGVGEQAVSRLRGSYPALSNICSIL